MIHAADTDEDVLARSEQIDAPLDRGRYSTLIRLASREDHRLVISLGGGASPAIGGNIALLQIVEELELRPHVRQVWGTSAGALVGGPWAAGSNAQEVMRYCLMARGGWDLRWLELGVSFLLRPFGWPLPQSLFKGRRFAELIERGMRASRFDECPIPFRCIATSTDSQPRAIVLDEGPLLPAILASMCIPGVFSPPCEAYKDCCDGGIIERTPLRSPISEHLRQGGSQTLLLVASHFGIHARRARPRDFIQRFFNGVDALEEISWPAQLQEARAYPNVLTLILNPRIIEAHPFNLDRLQLHYWRAREFFADRLQNARLALSMGAE